MADDPTMPRPVQAPPPPPPPPPPTRGSGATRPSPTVRATWLAAGSALAILGLIISTLQVVGQIAHEEHEESVRFNDPAISVLDVSTDGGTVEVIGADVADLRIEARVSDGLIETAFTSEVVGDRLHVRVRCRGVIVNEWCRAKLRIVVPRDLEVKVRSASDSVTLRSLDGRVDAETGDGTVEAESLGGATRLRSANGSVRGSRLRTSSVQADSDNGSVRLELAVTPLSVIAHSDNGSVDVAVPRGDESYAVDAGSGNGSTDTLVRTDPASQRRIVASTSNGNITVRYVE